MGVASGAGVVGATGSDGGETCGEVMGPCATGVAVGLLAEDAAEARGLSEVDVTGWLKGVGCCCPLRFPLRNLRRIVSTETFNR